MAWLKMELWEGNMLKLQIIHWIETFPIFFYRHFYKHEIYEKMLPRSSQSIQAFATNKTCKFKSINDITLGQIKLRFIFDQTEKHILEYTRSIDYWLYSLQNLPQKSHFEKSVKLTKEWISSVIDKLNKKANNRLIKVSKSVYIAKHTYQFCWQYAKILVWKT